ncbi:MAG: sigma-70 family RNA polymerase sigma factor [Acidobacteria bacterium]|nr:sigma-70 family RNA polymerase sigma factor [Acidobacteriota bacterium]
MLFGRKTEPGEFEAAAMPHMNDLFRTACGLLGNRTEAEDLIQDVYLNAWRSFHRFEPGTNCRAWMFKILFHRLHHHRRKWYQMRLLREGEEFLEENLPATEPIPEKISDKAILAAIDKLAPEFREVLLLADVEEFAYKEIAAMLDVPVGTVMSRLSRARRQMRERLTEYARDSYGIANVRDEKKVEAAL